jgi:hypothetical protein
VTAVAARQAAILALDMAYNLAVFTLTFLTTVGVGRLAGWGA